MSNLARVVYIIILFVLGVCLNTKAQVPDNARGLRYQQNKTNAATQSRFAKLANAKKEYFERQLNLTATESKKFWPLYRQYQQQLINIRHLKRLNNSSAQPNGTEQINKELYYETELVNIHKRYNEEFMKILPAEKVSELYKSEKQFNDEVLKQLSERSERAGN
ncbi:hypothetical protein IM792_07025 [Mucilaginibacter sp. JRF]|uniref:hypothetical protein n=1 Tax=Mucilaginibacter sp. JRF TaxID=2780088 RepID=UPI00187FE20E|nr:hypothetical protein [Mucilaginibacter sp. JRF]MBE9584195.1 hypothetical protein [Mucilaginibacter sp. JRF]